MNFHVVERTDHRPSVTALDDAEHAIAGAYLQRDLWRCYVTSVWADAIGVPFVPDPLTMWSKKQAVHWVQMLAAAYVASHREAA